MRTLKWVAVFSGWICASQGAVAQLPSPAGTWHFNGDGYEGELVLEVGDGGRVTGTVYGDRVVGWYDSKTNWLNFVRTGDPKNATVQTFKGWLFSNNDGKEVRYTLAGTFAPNDPGGSADGVPEMGWYAQRTAGAKPKDIADAVEARGLFDGTWKFNGDGYEGDLVLAVKNGQVTGTVYGNEIAGSYNFATKRINFLRVCVPNDPKSFQAHVGYLFANQDGKKTRYTLAGTFFNIGNTAEMGWYAQLVLDLPPVSGKKAAGVELIDAIMLKNLKKLGCTAASVTVARGGTTLYSRGYGWSDRDRTLPMTPNTPMNLASCDKPITAAMILQLARDGKLDRNASVLKLMKTKPAGEVVDERVWDITIDHLYRSQAGWQGEPIMKAWREYNGGLYPLESFEGLLEHAMVQKLAWAPGEKTVYDSFGFNTLKTVVARVSGRTYVDYLRHELLRSHGIKKLKWVRDHGPGQKEEPPQLWNGLIMEDPKEYRMGVSTPALCTFMQHFWITGEPIEKKENRGVAFNGATDQTISQMNWRADGINIAWVFNGTAAEVDPGTELDKAVDQLVKDERLPK